MTRALSLVLFVALACVTRAQCPCVAVPDSLVGRNVEVCIRDVLVSYGDWGWSDDPVAWADSEPESVSFEFGELVATGPYLVLVDAMFGTATRIPCEVVVGLRQTASAPR